MAQTLGNEQKKRLYGALQAGLDQSAAALRMMLGGRLEIRPRSPVLKESGIQVRLGLHGALEGGVHIDLPEQMADQVVKRLTGRAELSLLDDQARSSLMELGNILASAFVAHFDQSRGIRTLPTPPQLSFVPREIPEFPLCYTAELYWSDCTERGEVLICMQQSALDILLS